MRWIYLRRIVIVTVSVAAVFSGLAWYTNRIIQRDRLGCKLLYALSWGDNITAKRLLHEGANPNIAEDYSPPTSLWNYCVERLLQPHSAHQHADIEASSSTPLLNAVQNNNTEMVHELLARGADPNLSNAQGETPLMSAYARPEIARLLLGDGAMVNTRTYRGWTALIDASTCGDTSFLKTLIARGALVNAITNEGYTGLMYAAGGGDNAAVVILLNAGADANIRAKDGMTALKWATQEGRTDTIKILKQGGARE
jgi:ankyrin repeat protein